MGAEKEIGPGKAGSSSNVDVQKSKNAGSGWRWTIGKFDVGVGVYQGSVLSPFFFNSANVLSEDGRKGALYELLYADDLVLMAETIEKLEAQFIRWKAAFAGKGLKINLGKTKVMESGGGSGIVVLAKIDPCSVCGKKAKINCVRCKTCKKLVHTRCARARKCLVR